MYLTKTYEHAQTVIKSKKKKNIICDKNITNDHF